ncbi:hypothetical protein FSP39_006745 [Pinctada imbricata]|uniref:Isopentenyl phosphate kinase n=1 Tax=Pinctada imbricata TaxID=66713 RepID=A0AA88YB26_PINIB|nr:hypothetical protein FSP39_006745 [Pinctada imbricata]
MALRICAQWAIMHQRERETERERERERERGRERERRTIQIQLQATLNCCKFSVDIVIKLGGSAVTVKEKFETLNKEGLTKACRLLNECVKARKRCIVVHGAGSFGHHQARKYNVNKGFNNLSEVECEKVKEGFCLTRLSVTKLNHIIVEALVEHGVKAVSISPITGWMTSQREVTKYDIQQIRALVTNGFVPVLHGDCVLDDFIGCCILSGDTIIKTICKEFDVKRVIFLSNVNGIYDRPPQQPGARHLGCIETDTHGSITSDIQTFCDQSYDVTGGIKLKIETCIDIVKNFVFVNEIVICNVDSDLAVLGSVCMSSDLEPSSYYTIVKLKR